ncbi:telomerase reverse transcriptase [Rosa chinensis]|nr:telomerase reverse transcriptase [Rosa chinensis]
MMKKRRVPQVLWRLFHHRARTLAHTLTSLLPPHSSSPNAQCRFCKGRRCLSCCTGPDAVSFLLRPDDPSDYRSLLDKCFVVVSENAPGITRFSPESHWSQIEIVRAVIETTMLEQSMSSNVICNGYDKRDKSSTIVELLTSSAWCLLLERVGDGIMVYLLKNASVFLRIPDKKHQQVTGPPISDLCRKRFYCTPNSQRQPSSLAPCGPRKKRKRDDNVHPMLKKKQFMSSVSIGESSSSGTCNGCCNHSENYRLTHSHISFSEASSPASSTLTNDYEGSLNQELTESLETLRKRSRPFRWQRCRKRRQLSLQETGVKGLFRTTVGDKQWLPGRLSSSLKPSLGRHYEQCNCLGFQVPQKVSNGAQIDRKSLFFNLESSSSVFPKKHVLNSVKPDSVGSEFLVQSIFGIYDIESALSKICPNGSGLCLMGSTCLYHSLVKLLKILIRRAQYGHHVRLLEKHCVVRTVNPNTIKSGGCISEGEKWEYNVLKKSQCCTADHCNKSPEVSESFSDEIKSYCLNSQVESFIWAVCRSIVPPELLGTPSNWRILRRTISKFIRLRRFERFSLKQCMHKLKTSRFPFLSNKHYFCCMNNEAPKHADGKGVDIQKGSSTLNDAVHIVKVKLLESWIYWFFSSVVVPLLQANFYVTESEHGKQDVYYYRKSVWEKVKNKTIVTCMDQSYQYLDDATTRRIIRKRSFGFSKLRICPKEYGVRLLANLKAPSKLPGKESCLADHSSGIFRGKKLHRRKVRFEHFKSVNRVLRDTHVVLKAMQLKETGKLGSSVFDYNDVYRKLCPFLIGMKSGFTMIPDVFIIVSDVSKAFDTVDQDKLLGVLKDVIRADEYFLQQSHHVIFKKGSLRIHDNRAFLDQNTGSRFKSKLRSVLVNQECSRSVKKKELFFNLNEHVKRNVLQLDKKFYLQRIGIPQGSVLSTLLCSLYYGHLDQNVIFPFLDRTWEPSIPDLSRGHDFQVASAAESSSEDKISSSSRYTLLRFIDDFLFISTSKAQAASFFSRLQRGFRDYNCYMNEKKFCVNFDIGNLPSNRVYSGDDGILFIRWSGLLINSRTLEVQADYTKYLKNHLSSTVTVHYQGKPGRHFKGKLRDYMRPKCHPLFFDSHINSASVVRLNIYQAFLLCAMKFHCYVRDLSCICKFHFGFYAYSIQKSLRYMHRLIKKRMCSLHTGSNFSPILQLEKGEVEWLGLYAYIQVLKRKQSRYKELLSLLKSKLLNHKITGCVSSELSYAVDRSHSSVIWKIKY